MLAVIVLDVVCEEILGFESPSKEIELDCYSTGSDHTFTMDDDVPTVVRGTLYPPVVESVAAGSPVSGDVAAASEEEESRSAVVVTASEKESWLVSNHRS
jgi:hypothetical protein